MGLAYPPVAFLTSIKSKLSPYLHMSPCRRAGRASCFFNIPCDMSLSTSKCPSEYLSIFFFFSYLEVPEAKCAVATSNVCTRCLLKWGQGANMRRVTYILRKHCLFFILLCQHHYIFKVILLSNKGLKCCLLSSEEQNQLWGCYLYVLYHEMFVIHTE